ncbi:uncharacterized protein LOC131158112 [Malania oleifera]|uniref:uncharacterized protein LOC131158112 n=1 Tax=Malania oleifera TaxID=397392 RepID=UPI0025ADBFA9|nr:uncharacterized protein LOC131158112 [Malania oleifera]
MEGSSASEALLETLMTRGWCFGDLERVKSVIASHFDSAPPDERFKVDSIESELAKMDLRVIGGKSLPDPIALRKSSHIKGPKVLQISSARDISRSGHAESSGSSNSRRLLRLNLTDGHSELTAVEYTRIPSIPDDVVPGSKVRLENKAVIHSGIVCLNAKVVTVLGGVVQALYEEWLMNKKYSGLSRSSLKPSGDDEIVGPPQFEKLQIGASMHQSAQQGRFSYQSESTHKNNSLRIEDTGGKSEIRQKGRQGNLDFKAEILNNDMKVATLTGKTEDMPSSSGARPKEVVESVPVQNQAASQKLLQKMSISNWDGQNFKNRKHRGKGKQEESPVFTLDEWEKSRAGIRTLKDELPDVSRDEDLAWQLQNQFDLEDLDVHRVPCETEAERLRRSMFKFERDDDSIHETGYRGRGRGRGRARGRGRRRGRGRFD